MEYAAAKSSICRQCGRSFLPFAPKPGLKLRTREETPAPESSSILGRFEDFWKRQRSSVVECFDCKRKQQVSGAATSTICPACRDRKSTRLNSSHVKISYAVFCLKKKKANDGPCAVAQYELGLHKAQVVVKRCGDRGAAQLGVEPGGARASGHG